MIIRLSVTTILFAVYVFGCVTSQTATQQTTTTTESKVAYSCGNKSLMRMDPVTEMHINLDLSRMSSFSPPRDEMKYYENWRKNVFDRIESRKEYLGDCYQYSEFKVETDKILNKIEGLDLLANQKWDEHLAAEKLKNNRIQQRQDKIRALNSGEYSSVYKDRNIEVRIIDVYPGKDKKSTPGERLRGLSFATSPTYVDVDVTVINQTKIVYVENTKVWGYEDGSEIGGSMPVNFVLSDSFGNTIPPKTVHPQLYGWGSHSDSSLRPGETKRFSIGFNGWLLESTEEFKIIFPAGSVGNEDEFTLLLPYSVLK